MQAASAAADAVAASQFLPQDVQGQILQRQILQGQMQGPNMQGQMQGPNMQGQILQRQILQGQMQGPIMQGQMQGPIMQGPNMQGQMQGPNMQGQMQGPNMQGQMQGPNMQGPNMQGQGGGGQGIVPDEFQTEYEFQRQQAQRRYIQQMHLQQQQQRQQQSESAWNSSPPSSSLSSASSSPLYLAADTFPVGTVRTLVGRVWHVGRGDDGMLYWVPMHVPAGNFPTALFGSDAHTTLANVPSRMPSSSAWDAQSATPSAASVPFDLVVPLHFPENVVPAELQQEARMYLCEQDKYLHERSEQDEAKSVLDRARHAYLRARGAKTPQELLVLKRAVDAVDARIATAEKQFEAAKCVRDAADADVVVASLVADDMRGAVRAGGASGGASGGAASMDTLDAEFARESLALTLKKLALLESRRAELKQQIEVAQHNLRELTRTRVRVSLAYETAKDKDRRVREEVGENDCLGPSLAEQINVVRRRMDMVTNQQQAAEADMIKAQSDKYTYQKKIAVFRATYRDLVGNLGKPRTEQVAWNLQSGSVKDHADTKGTDLVGDLVGGADGDDGVHGASFSPKSSRRLSHWSSPLAEQLATSGLTPFQCTQRAAMEAEVDAAAAFRAMTDATAIMEQVRTGAASAAEWGKTETMLAQDVTLATTAYTNAAARAERAKAVLRDRDFQTSAATAQDREEQRHEHAFRAIMADGERKREFALASDQNKVDEKGLRLAQQRILALGPQIEEAKRQVAALARQLQDLMEAGGTTPADESAGRVRDGALPPLGSSSVYGVTASAAHQQQYAEFMKSKNSQEAILVAQGSAILLDKRGKMVYGRIVYRHNRRKRRRRPTHASASFAASGADDELVYEGALHRNVPHGKGVLVQVGEHVFERWRGDWLHGVFQLGWYERQESVTAAVPAPRTSSPPPPPHKAAASWSSSPPSMFPPGSPPGTYPESGPPSAPPPPPPPSSSAPVVPNVPAVAPKRKLTGVTKFDVRYGKYESSLVMPVARHTRGDTEHDADPTGKEQEGDMTAASSGGLDASVGDFANAADETRDLVSYVAECPRLTSGFEAQFTVGRDNTCVLSGPIAARSSRQSSSRQSSSRDGKRRGEEQREQREEREEREDREEREQREQREQREDREEREEREEGGGGGGGGSGRDKTRSSREEVPRTDGATASFRDRHLEFDDQSSATHVRVSYGPVAENKHDFFTEAYYVWQFPRTVAGSPFGSNPSPIPSSSGLGQQLSSSDIYVQVGVVDSESSVSGAIGAVGAFLRGFTSGVTRYVSADTLQAKQRYVKGVVQEGFHAVLTGLGTATGGTAGGGAAGSGLVPKAAFFVGVGGGAYEGTVRLGTPHGCGKRTLGAANGVWGTFFSGWFACGFRRGTYSGSSSDPQFWGTVLADASDKRDSGAPSGLGTDNTGLYAQTTGQQTAHGNTAAANANDPQSFRFAGTRQSSASWTPGSIVQRACECVGRRAQEACTHAKSIARDSSPLPQLVVPDATPGTSLCGGSAAGAVAGSETSMHLGAVSGGESHNASESATHNASHNASQSASHNAGVVASEPSMHLGSASHNAGAVAGGASHNVSQSTMSKMDSRGSAGKKSKHDKKKQHKHGQNIRKKHSKHTSASPVVLASEGSATSTPSSVRQNIVTDANQPHGAVVSVVSRTAPSSEWQREMEQRLGALHGRADDARTIADKHAVKGHVLRLERHLNEALAKYPHTTVLERYARHLRGILELVAIH